MNSNNNYRIKWGGAEYDRNRYIAKKQKLLDILGNKCVECGSIDDLEFDHIDSKTKAFTIMDRWNRSIKHLLPELKKCQLLCRTCHNTKTHGVPHGGGKSGKRNCSCDLCKAKKAEYMREWQKSNRKLPT